MWLNRNAATVEPLHSNDRPPSHPVTCVRIRYPRAGPALTCYRKATTPDMPWSATPFPRNESARGLRAAAAGHRTRTSKSTNCGPSPAPLASPVLVFARPASRGGGVRDAKAGNNIGRLWERSPSMIVGRVFPSSNRGFEAACDVSLRRRSVFASTGAAFRTLFLYARDRRKRTHETLPVTWQARVFVAVAGAEVVHFFRADGLFGGPLALA